MVTIVVIQDERNNERNIGFQLIGKNYQVEIYGSILECFLKTNFGETDLIVSDVRLSGENVFEFVSTLSRHYRSIPFVLLTSFADLYKDHFADLALAGGIYFVDPSDHNRLHFTIEQALKKSCRQVIREY